MYFNQLIHRFWDFNKGINIGSTAIAMYLYLLKIGEDQDRYDFNISDLKISSELGITRKTITPTRVKLQTLGLIQFQTKNGLPCSYRLLLTFPMCVDESLTQAVEKVSTPLATNNSQERNVQTETIVLTQSSLHIDTNKVNLAKTPVENTPTIEEFFEYAMTLKNYNSELDIAIRLKYERWDMNDWKNGCDRPITNWKASLKNIMPYISKIKSEQPPLSPMIPTIKRP